MTIQSKWVNRIFRRQINVSLVIVGLVILTLLLFSPYIPNNIDLNVGDVAPMTVVSPRFITFQTASDRRDTEDLRRRRVALVDRVYAVDRDLNKGVLSQVVNMFTDLRRLDGHALGGNRIPDSLRFLTGSQIRYLEKLSPDALNRLEKLTVTTTEAMLLEGFREVNPSEVTLRVRTHLHDASISPDDAAMLSAIIGHVVKPNLVYSESMTRKAQLRELNTIKPVTSELKQGEPIFYKGSVVTSDNIEALKALNMYGRQMNLFKLTGLGMMAALILLLIERFIYHFNRRNHGQVKYFGLLYFVIFSVVAIARILMGVELFDGLINSYFLIPIPMAAMLVSLLVTTNISLLVCTAIAILVTSMWSGDFNVFVFLFLSAAVSTFSIYKRFSRSELMISGYIVGAFNIVLVLTVGLVREINDPFWFLANMIASFATGVISSMVTLAVVPYLEGLFSVTTQQTLLELSNLNHPLLKRLMMTAPGTYQHSLMVANLAEAAAESIQADAILCRVGAYYHDIGKMKRPLFFTENQFSGENPHATLTPRMSKMVISSHPRDGYELATKYHLPQVLKDFILEHHGTTMVSFFYSQALQSEGPHDPDAIKDDFRYPGPKPHFKESGIVMLADSVEAAVRSMEKPTPTKIENMVDKIFRDKMDDDQLVDCPLSLKEIELIRETFLRVFKGIYHSRIDYHEELDSIINHGKPKKSHD